MIIGLGEDLVEISRIARLIEDKGDHFLAKCFTPFEIEKAEKHKTKDRIHSYYAKRFAAKEACLKALGTGMRAGISWQDMRIGNDDMGRPLLTVSGGVSDRLNEIAKNKDTAIHITLSDEAGLAKATVILESLSTVSR
ncbi:MAG: holo-ACP synthase [Alphaproteobacteria bacterium]|nr:MAG: holo-ACP synthase [Alphaproteobacteria bacterium]